MKLLALLLALVNVALWYYGPSLVPSTRSTAQGEGVLPRVSTLKAVGEPAARARSASPRSYCIRLGWFEAEEDAQAEARTYDLGSDQFRVDRQERELPPLHWVLIPPQPPAQAREAFRDIQRRGIDSYLVTEGKNSYAISLGLFESKESAISVLEEKKSQNLNAILAIFPRNQISYALVFEAGHFQNTEEIQTAETDYRRDFDLVEIGRCEGVATPEKNP